MQATRPYFRLARTELNLLLLGLVALVSCALLWWGNQLWWQSYATYVPATDNLRQARHDGTRAFLLQSKRVAGEAVDRQEIAALLDSAALSVEDMLSGRSTLQDIPAQTPESSLRQQIRDYQLAQREFILISQRLLDGIGEAEILSISQRNAFHAAEQMANRLESELVLQLGARIRQQQHEQHIGLLLWLGFLTLLFLMMWRSARIEASLARQQQLMHTIIEGSSDAIFVKDMAGRYELFNTGAAQIASKAVTDVLGQTDAHIFSPEAAARIGEIDRSIIASGTPRSHEECVTMLNGEEKVFWVTKGPLLEPDGQASGLFGISRDITQYKQVEAALAASEMRFRAYIENAPFAVWVVDTNGRFVDANPEGLKLLGYSLPALQQTRLPDLSAPPDRELLRQQFQQLNWKGRLNGKFGLLNQAGHELWLQLTAARIVDGLFIVYGWNVSEQGRKEDALENTNASGVVLPTS